VLLWGPGGLYSAADMLARNLPRRLILSLAVASGCQDVIIPDCGEGGEWVDDRCMCIMGYELDELVRRCVALDGGMPDAFVPTDSGLDACDEVLRYRDEDADGRGDPAVSMMGCLSEGWVANRDDCDDTCPSCWAAAEETCDAEDNDCDGYVDEGVTSYGDVTFLTTAGAAALSGAVVPTVRMGTDHYWVAWRRSSDGEMVTATFRPSSRITSTPVPAFPGVRPLLSRWTVGGERIVLLVFARDASEFVVYARAYDVTTAEALTDVVEITRARAPVTPHGIHAFGEGFAYVDVDGDTIRVHPLLATLEAWVEPLLVPAGSRRLIEAEVDADSLLLLAVDDEQLEYRRMRDDGPDGDWTELMAFDAAPGAGVELTTASLTETYLDLHLAVETAVDRYTLAALAFAREDVGFDAPSVVERLDDRDAIYSPAPPRRRGTEVERLVFRLGAASGAIVDYSEDRRTVASTAVSAPVVVDAGIFYLESAGDFLDSADVAFRPRVCE